MNATLKTNMIKAEVKPSDFEGYYLISIYTTSEHVVQWWTLTEDAIKAKKREIQALFGGEWVSDTDEFEATEAPQAVPSVEDIEAGNEYVLSLPDLEYTTHDDDGLYTLRLRDKTDGVIVNAWEMETAPELWRKMNLLCSGASGYKWTKA